MAREYLSPGVSYKEIEELAAGRVGYKPVIAVVGGASKGPFEATEVRSQKQLTKLYGNALDTDFAVFAAHYILEESCVVLFKRVKGTGTTLGTATSETSKFSFTTRDYDSTLNGAVISLKFNKEKKTVDYMLKVGNKVVENYINLSYEEGDDKFLPTFLESVGSKVVAAVNAEVTEVADVVLTVRGVVDGVSTLTAQDYIDAADEFSNADNIEVSVIIVPGVSDTEVQTAYANLARTRGDCVYLPDIPFGTTPETAHSFINSLDEETSSIRLDNEWVAAFGPWVKVTDIARAKDVWAPPSVIAASVIAQSDNISGGCWVAAAGFADGRGVVKHAVACEYELTKEDRDLWQGNGGVLNPIVYFKGLGTVIFGNKTTKRTPEYQEESVYCSLNIRRMANYIKRLVIQVSLSELFNPNDSLTWASWKAKLNPLLKVIKDGRGIEDYKIVMDETTVTEDDVRAGRAPGIIYVKPVRALEYIPITFAVTENSVIFTDSEEV